MKLFGGASGARTIQDRAAAVSASGGAAVAQAPVRQKNPLKVLAIILAVLLVIELGYFFCVHTENAFVSKWRKVYISTAMDTMSHQWLATAFIPHDIIASVVGNQQQAMAAQEGLESQWQKPAEDVAVGDPVLETEELDMTVVETKDPEEVARDSFFTVFHELDQASFNAYLDANPSVLADGWQNLVINEAGLDDDGTDIQTVYGEQVLAIDYPNRILLIQVKGDGYRGVLAVAKDPSRLSLRPASTLGTKGETVGQIAQANNGVLAMTGSGFMDDNGGGSGGVLTGLAVTDGAVHGWSFVAKGEKRLELHEDNLFYIKDTSDPLGEGTTDAVEWHPAVVVDGQDVLGAGWDGLHPRSMIGQSDKYEILMLAVEGRQPTRSLGITLYECANILLRHNCMQAMNLDGGTSAMIWYDGEPVISCSNTSTPEGRNLPTAWVYARDTVG